MTPLVTWKSTICCPYPTSPPFPRKRVPLVLLEWLRKEQNSIFPFIQRTFLGLCSFHVSGRQRYFITVHFPKWLKCPGTHTCGMSHQKCNLALELSSKPATLVIDPRTVSKRLVRPDTVSRMHLGRIQAWPWMARGSRPTEGVGTPSKRGWGGGKPEGQYGVLLSSRSQESPETALRGRGHLPRLWRSWGCSWTQ